MRRDPFESVLACSLAFGGVFMVGAVVKLVSRVAAGVASGDGVPAHDGFFAVFGFLAGFAVLIGPVVAFARRKMGPQRSFQAKNLVTGGLVGACYSLGCTVVLAGDMDATGKIAVGVFTFVGIWWAIASGLNEAFREKSSG